MCMCFFFFFKQKTAYEMRISDWSSDVCSSDLDDPLSAYSNPPILPQKRNADARAAEGRRHSRVDVAREALTHNRATEIIHEIHLALPCQHIDQWRHYRRSRLENILEQAASAGFTDHNDIVRIYIRVVVVATKYRTEIVNSHHIMSPDRPKDTKIVTVPHLRP